jgi:hypothetical protein
LWIRLDNSVIADRMVKRGFPVTNLTCWNWLTLALALVELEKRGSRKKNPCEALRAQILGASEAADRICTRTSSPVSSYALTVAVTYRLPRRAVVYIRVRASPQIPQILAEEVRHGTPVVWALFPLDEVLVCLDWIDEHPGPSNKPEPEERTT